jgi:hypothetical protein
MKIIELMKGVYAVGRGDISGDTEFFRFSKDDLEQLGYRSVAEGAQPLMHICERSDDPTQQHPTDIVVLDKVKWDFMMGFYFCNGCKSIFNEPGDLEMIWEDGEGTGFEAHA